MTQTTVQMYATEGWQNIQDKVALGLPINIRIIDVPTEHAHPEISYTSARHWSVNDLVLALSIEADVNPFKIKTQFEQ